MKRQRGFTLLELAVVIAVISVLLAFTAGSFRARRGDARVQKTLADLQALGDVVESHWHRGGATTAPAPYWLTNSPNPLNAPPDPLLPPVIANAWGAPFRVTYQSAPARVTIATCVGPEAQGIGNLDPRITVNPGCALPGFPASFWATYSRRFYYSESGFRMKLEKSLLHQDP